MRRNWPIKAWTIIALLTPVAMQTVVHADEDEDEGQVELVFSATERAELGIVTSRSEQRTLMPEINAPAEVLLNGYRTTQIAPRIEAQVVERFARMGESLEGGAPLVTLSSVDMAEAVGDLLVRDREWRRVDALGRDVVSESRYVEAQVNRQQAYARVLAYGMRKVELQQVLTKADASQATGEYTLFAPHDGVVIRDPFVIGEVVDAGRLLMELSDLSILWVEARVDPDLVSGIQVHDVVRVSADDQTWFAGQVVQKSPHLNESTRTLSVRIEVVNDGTLTPGQFVNAAIETDSGSSVVAVPRDAVVLIFGSPMVFVLDDNEFKPRPVEVGANAQAWTAITAGLDVGEEIAIEGVFQLKSLLLKSQIGDTD